jgi:drug/metabolite transporter (DMT)-like permease
MYFWSIPVVVSAPITATYPAFALLFGFLLQRRTEVITPRVTGTLAIVAGGAILVW